MSSASSSKKRSAEAHEGSEKNPKKSRKSASKDTSGEAMEELEMQVKSVKSAIKLLSNKKNLEKKIEITIERGGKRYEAESFRKKDYPNVYGITMNHFDLNWKEFFKHHMFSGINELRIDCSLQTKDQFDTISGWKWIEQFNMEAIFSGMKNLKHLYLRAEVPRFYDEVSSAFKLESADVYCIFPFIEESHNTLKQLKICLKGGEGGDELGDVELQDFYSNYKKLENFSAVFCLSEKVLKKRLPKKESMKHLDIHVYTDNDAEGKNLAYLEFILTASPSLETLTMYTEISAAFVQFLASNMPKLEKVIGRGGIAADALAKLEELKQNKDSKENTGFEINLEENRPLKKEFKGFYCK